MSSIARLDGLVTLRDYDEPMDFQANLERFKYELKHYAAQGYDDNLKPELDSNLYLTRFSLSIATTTNGILNQLSKAIGSRTGGLSDEEITYLKPLYSKFKFYTEFEQDECSLLDIWFILSEDIVSIMLHVLSKGSLNTDPSQVQDLNLAKMLQLVKLHELVQKDILKTFNETEKVKAEPLMIAKKFTEIIEAIELEKLTPKNIKALKSLKNSLQEYVNNFEVHKLISLS